LEKDSLSRLNQLHPLIRQSAIDAYNEAVKATPIGVHPYVIETYRSFAESDKLYAQGRTEPGEIVSYSKGGQSYHNYGLALDCAILINGKISWEVDNNFMIVVNCFKKHAFTWGGDFPKGKKDYPHFEKRLGYNWRQLLAMHAFNNNFIAGTLYLKLNDQNTV
jgi:peptidoglycan L-alanyl-D-glutamate endopeptidase CwlK